MKILLFTLHFRWIFGSEVCWINSKLSKSCLTCAVQYIHWYLSVQLQWFCSNV